MPIFKKFIILLLFTGVLFYSFYEKLYLNLNSSLQSEAKEEYSDEEIIGFLLKSSEGLRFKAWWDYSQWSIGWGTKSFKGEVIDLKESNKRMNKAYNFHYNKIKTKYPFLSKWDRMVLAVMRYNVGSFGPDLREAIRGRNKKDISIQMLRYVYTTTDEYLEGLENRRKLEVKLFNASSKEKQKIGKELRKKVIEEIKRANS